MAGRPMRDRSEPILAVFPDYSRVALTSDVQHQGRVFPAGTKGVIVDRHGDGLAYEVEFEQPAFAVISLTGDHLKAAE